MTDIPQLPAYPQSSVQTIDALMVASREEPTSIEHPVSDALDWPLADTFCARCTMSLREKYIWADWLYLGMLVYCERCQDLSFEPATLSEQNRLADGREWYPKFAPKEVAP